MVKKKKSAVAITFVPAKEQLQTATSRIKKVHYFKLLVYVRGKRQRQRKTRFQREKNSLENFPPRNI